MFTVLKLPTRWHDKRMPRRKKKVKEVSESRNLEKKDVETTSSVGVKRKRRLEDAFIVISDSDGEEPKEENGLQKTKTKQSNRAKCLAKRKIAQMTEEEQFALALKMSEQEAREVNSQEEEEEELLRKAIAESLNSSQGIVEETSEEGNSVPASQSVAALTSKGSLVLMPESSTEEITVCPETQLSSSETFDLEREVSPGSREILDGVRIIMADKEVGNKEDAEKEIAISTFSSSNQVSCPLCDQHFPPTKIERHAMYCNGLMEEDTVLTRRQKEAKAKTKSDSGTAAQTSLDIDKNEKCYLCKSLVPFREYQCHVDSCLQLAKADQGDGPEGGGRAFSTVEGKWQQRLKNPKEKGHSEGRLLSFLEQSEHKTSDADIKSSETGAFRVPSPGMEEAGCSREMQSSFTRRDLNESPVKSFVSISEATDCLVDFKKQVTVQPGSRTRTKAGRGRRRKF
ncbi:BRCA1-A complex subunit RAP80 isoform X6 [Pan paniscus]